MQVTDAALLVEAIAAIGVASCMLMSMFEIRAAREQLIVSGFNPSSPARKEVNVRRAAACGRFRRLSDQAMRNA